MSPAAQRHLGLDSDGAWLAGHPVAELGCHERPIMSRSDPTEPYKNSLPATLVVPGSIPKTPETASSYHSTDSMIPPCIAMSVEVVASLKVWVFDRTVGLLSARRVVVQLSSMCHSSPGTQRSAEIRPER